MFVGTAWNESTFFYSDSSRCGWTLPGDYFKPSTGSIQIENAYL